MSVNTNQIVNANIYINGNNLLGKASEVDAPKVMAKMIEYKALGLIGSFELPSGLDKMDMRIKWNAYYADVATVMLNPWKSINVMIRANQEVWQGGDKTDDVPVIIYATCQSKGFPAGNFKPQDSVDAESNLTVTHCKMEIDGVEVFEVDVMNNIYKVDGVDIMQQYRANIGG